MLEVPASLNRNAKDVQDQASPAETGRMLVNYMCERIGIHDLAGIDILDFGCGVRFSEAFLNFDLAVGTYTGIDVEPKVIAFLKENVVDPRFTYHRLNVANKYYNADGEPHDPDAPSTIREVKFDIACMFSVITHQNPAEAVPTFMFLRRHIRPKGHLFFSAFIHDDPVDFKELGLMPGEVSSYSLQRLTEILSTTGWYVVSVADPHPNDLPIMTSFLCRPQ